MESSNEKPAINYLVRARTLHRQQEYPQALQCYLHYLDSLPDVDECPLSIQMDLTKLVIKLGDIFNEVGHSVQAVEIYTKVISIFPGNSIILNLMAVMAFKFDNLQLARQILQRTLEWNYLPAEQNLLHIIWQLVPRWHFRMLNDSVRNNAYKSSIDRAIASGFRDVYDIGCGCGLLTLIAASNKNVNKVTSFETNKILMDMARQLVLSNNLQGKVEFHEKNSTDCSEAPSPCNLIVTEIFDVALFGEWALETLRHARRVFLNGDFKIIPAGAKLHVCAIENRKLISKHRYMNTFPSLKLESVCITCENAEYEAEWINKNETKFLTEPIQFANVDFSRLDELTLEETELHFVKNGRVDALAVWFDLILDEETEISTNPLNSSVKCWEQAVFFLDHPYEVIKGQTLKVKPYLVNNELKFEIPQKCNAETCFKVSQDIIAFLNDTSLVQAITAAVENFKNKPLNILDFNCFPLFGLLMCQKGARLCHIYKFAKDLDLFKYILKCNYLPEQNTLPEDKLFVTDLTSYNAVFFNAINRDGCWHKLSKSIEVVVSKEDSNLVPEKVVLKAVLVSSPYVDYCNKVDDSKALNFGIAEYMNPFSGTEQPNIDNMEYEEMSTRISFDVTTDDGVILSLPAVINKSGNINGILFWFEVQFAENAVFSTLNSTYYSKACSLLPNTKNVKQGDFVTVNVERMENYMKLYCD